MPGCGKPKPSTIKQKRIDQSPRTACPGALRRHRDMLQYEKSM